MNHIRERRKALGLTQVRLGILVGLANSLISDFELDKRKPWPRARRSLARALKCGEAELFPNIGKEGGQNGN